MQGKFRFAVKVCICLAVFILTGFVLLVLAYCLPTERMRRNVADSTEQISSEGCYFQWVKGYKNAQADTYTDASLILNAIYPGSGHLLQDAMNAPRILYGDDDNENSVILLATGKEGETHEVHYGRYWHGSLIFLKPMLLLFDLSDIRIISMILQVGLLFLVIVGMVKRELIKPLFGLFLSVVLLNPVSMIMCFCFSIEYILMLAFTSYMLFYHEKLREGWGYYFFFLINGILFVYFNELSFPMIGFGIPMTVYLLLSEETAMTKVKKEFAYGAMWLLGYGTVWIGKWILSWMITGFNYFAEALGQAKRYTSDHATWEIENPSTLDRLLKNMNVYFKWPYLLLFILMLLLISFYLIRGYKNISRDNIVQMLPYFLMLLFPPAIWVILGNGYSYVHYWFTHRLISISAFAGICMILQITEKKKDDLLYAEDHFSR